MRATTSKLAISIGFGASLILPCSALAQSGVNPDTSDASATAEAESNSAFNAADWAPAILIDDSGSFLTQCGAVNESVDVNNYPEEYPKLAEGVATVDPEYVSRHEASSVQLEWTSESKVTAILGEEYNNLESNIGTTYRKGRRCSGTMVAEDLILTAGHCLSSFRSLFPVLNGKKVGPKVAAKLLQINFNYQVPKGGGNPASNEHSYPVTELVAYSVIPGKVSSMDYALLRFDPGGEDSFARGVTPATVSNRAPSVGETIALIQHPHGTPKKIESGLVVSPDGSDITRFPESISGQWVYYSDVDTFNRSSGSGIRDANGSIIGVHTYGGCKKTGPAKANKGITMAAIFQHSQKVREELFEE